MRRSNSLQFSHDLVVLDAFQHLIGMHVHPCQIVVEPVDGDLPGVLLFEQAPCMAA